MKILKSGSIGGLLVFFWLILVWNSSWSREIDENLDAKLRCGSTASPQDITPEEINIEIKKIDFNKGKPGTVPAWGSMSSIFKVTDGKRQEGYLLVSKKNNLAFSFTESEADGGTLLSIYEIRRPTLIGKRTVIRLFSNANSYSTSELRCLNR